MVGGVVHKATSVGNRGKLKGNRRERERYVVEDNPTRANWEKKERTYTKITGYKSCRINRAAEKEGPRHGSSRARSRRGTMMNETPFEQQGALRGKPLRGGTTLYWEKLMEKNKGQKETVAHICQTSEQNPKTTRINFPKIKTTLQEAQQTTKPFCVVVWDGKMDPI